VKASYWAEIAAFQNSPDRSGWKIALACLVRFKCGNGRHLGDAFQDGTVREKMKGILEMPSISG